MITSDALSKVFVLAGKIEAVTKAKDDITLANAFYHPDVTELRDALLAVVGDDGSVEEMIATARALNQEFNRLVLEPYSNENMGKLAAVGGAARTISILAEMKAAEPLQIFHYTMSTLWPYLEGLAKVGVLVIGAVV